MSRSVMQTCVAVVFALCAVRAGATDAPEPAGRGAVEKGKIESVTLYRGQALVTRVVTVRKAPAGGTQLVVSDLPERVRADSLYAAADAATQVRSVRYRTQVVTEAPQPDVRDIDKEIEPIEKEMRKNRQEQDTLGRKAAYLDKLEDFTASTAKADLTKGVLNADTLKQLTEFTFDQRSKLADALLALREAEQKSKKDLETLQQRRAQLTRTNSRVLREAVVFLDRAREGDAVVRLSYLVDGASWSPSYNLRTAPKKETVAIEYNAIITQMSGENWPDAALTLSTATPSMTADAPMLAPLLVALRSKLQDSERLERIREQFNEASTQLKTLEERRQHALDRGSQIEAQWWLNQAAQGYQIWELYVPESLARVARDVMRQEVTGGLSVNYALEGRVSVDSREDQQIARIANLTLSAEFTNVAVPLLTEYVYRQATVTNDSKIALLEGQGSVYLDGEFVGKGTVPMVPCGRRFLAGFGVAPELRAKRELVSKSEQIQGANREVTYHYRLLLENYANEAAAVRVFDRIPYAQEDVRVTPIDVVKLSTDEEYNRVYKPQGILRWDMLLDKQTVATKANVMEYRYKLEYDKNTDITTATGSEREAKVRAMFEKQLGGF